MTYYECAACGFDRLQDPPSDHNICECCGTQFGYHDATLSHADLRSKWVAYGAKWHSRRFPPSPGWPASKQLERFQVSRP